MQRAALRENFLQAPVKAGGSPTLGGGRWVYVFKSGTQTPIDEALYDSASGGGALPQPLLTAPDGALAAWKQSAERVTLLDVASGALFDSEFRVDPQALGIAAGGTAKFDGLQSLHGSCMAGSDIITVPVEGDLPGFSPSDVGKLMVVNDLVYGTGPQVSVIVAEVCVGLGHIAQWISPTQVRLSVPVTATMTYTPSPPPGVYDNGGRVIWGTDDTFALQALFNEIQTDPLKLAGAEVRLPAGIAMVSAPLSFSARFGASLVGAGSVNAPNVPFRGTTIVGCVNDSVLKVSGEGVTIRGLAIDGAGGTAVRGIHLDNGLYFSHVEQVRVNACQIGLFGDREQFTNEIHDLSVYYATHGLFLQPASGTAIQKVDVYGLSCEFCSGNAVYLAGVELVNFFGGAVQTSPYGMTLTNNALLVNVYGMQLEGLATAAVYIPGGPAGAPGAIAPHFRDCRFRGGAVVNAVAILANSSLDGVWQDCMFDFYPATSPGVINFQNVGGTPVNFYNSIVGGRFQDNACPKTVHMDGAHFGRASSCELTNSANIPISSGASYPSAGVLTFDTRVSDTDSLYQPTVQPGAIVIGKEGPYHFVLSGTFAASASGTNRQLGLVVTPAGGSPAFVATNNDAPSASRSSAIQVVATRYCLAGDVIQAHATHDASTSLNLLALGLYSPRLSATQIA